MKTKIIILVIVSLVVGIAIGMTISAYMTKQKIEKWKQGTTPDGMYNNYIKLLQPTAEQADTLEFILREYVNTSVKMMGETWMNQGRLFDEMEKKINPLLDEDQLQRMEDFKEKFRKFGTRPPKKDGDSNRKNALIKDTTLKVLENPVDSSAN
jgi:MFS superfamily sulfate permease-like transporter